MTTDNPGTPLPPQDPAAHPGPAAPASRPGAAPPPPPPKRRRRWRKWVIGLGVVVLLLLLLVLLLPTLIGTGPVRSLIVSQVNGRIPGSIKIDDLSLGWTRGISVTNLNVYDERNALILEVPRFKTDLTLLKAVRGDLAIGETIADVNLTRVVVDENNVTNVQRALGLAEPEGQTQTTEPSQPQQPEPSAPQDPAPAEGETKLPNISGGVALNILGGTIEIPSKLRQPIFVQPGYVKAHFPDINQPINNSAQIAYRLGDGTPGTLRLNGNLDIAENNVLTIEKLSGTEDVILETLDLSPIATFLPPEQAMELAGVANGGFQIRANGLNDAKVDGKIIVSDLLVGGAPLNGDTYRTKSLGLPIGVAMTQGPTGPVVNIQRVAVESEELNVEIAGKVSQQALANLADNKPPGETGDVTVKLAVPQVAAVANQLPNTLNLGEGVTVTGGELRSETVLTLRPDAAAVKTALNVNAEGTRKDEKGAAQPIRLDPVTFDLAATAFPSGKPVPRVADVALNLASNFATLKGGGQSLDKLALNGNFDLAKLQQQLAQFSDLGDLQLQGAGTLALSTKGDVQQVAEQGGAVEAHLLLILNDIRVAGLEGKPPIEQPRLALDVKGDVELASDYSLGRVRSGVVSMQSGKKNSPTVDLEASVGEYVPAGSNPLPFKLAKLNVTDLAQAQREFGAFVPALQEMKLDIASGQLTATAAGTSGPDEIRLTEPFDLAIKNLTVRKLDDAGQPHDVIAKENLRAQLAGVVKMPEGGLSADLSALSVTSESGLVKLAKAPDAPLTFSQSADGAIQANGVLAVGADLARLLDISERMATTQPTQVAQQDQAGKLESGVLDATLKLARGQGEQTTVNLDGAIAKVTVSGGSSATTQPVRNEMVILSLRAETPKDFARLVANGRVQSSFANVEIADANLLLLKGEPPPGQEPTTMPAFEMLQAATVKVNAPDVAKLYAVANAFTPPATQPAEPLAEGEEPEPPLPPLEVNAGAATVALDVKRDAGVTRVNVSDTTITNLAFHRGGVPYTFEKPITVKAAAELAAVDAIQSIRVGTLNADLGGLATVALAEPLELSNLEADVPTARGTLSVNGQLGGLSDVFEALQGAADAYPYRGQLAMTQKLATDPAGKLSLVPNLTITDFQVFTPGQAEPVVNEPKVELAGDVVVDPDAKTLLINALNLNMPTSGALQLAAKGAVRDWETQRQFDGLRLDLGYDLEKLWPILRPLMVPESAADLAELKVAGQAKRAFEVSGSLPANLPFNEAIKQLTATGGLAVGSFDFKGVNIQKLELPVTLVNGRLMTIYEGKRGADRLPPPAVCNGGTLNLGGIVLDMTYDTPRVDIGKNHELLKGVTLNPLFADNILGKFINPTFVNPERAEGLVDVTVVQCQKVPLGELIQQRGGKNDGRAEIVLSITEMNIGNKFVNELVTTLKPNAFNNNALQGNIKNAKIVIGDGFVNQNMAIAVDGYALRFDGAVRLADQALMPLNFNVPSALLARVNDDLMKFLPEGITVPISGTTAAPRFGLREAATKAIAEAGKRALLGELVGGRAEKPDPKKDGGSTRPSAPPKPEEQVQDLLEGLLNRGKR